MQEFLSVKDVAKYLGVQEMTVYRYLQRYKRPLPSMKLSQRKILVKKEDLESWLNESKTSNAEGTE